MDNKVYRTVIDIINIILGFLGVYAIMFTILLLTENASASLPLFLLSLAGVLLSYCINRFTKHIWSFFLFHFLLITVLFFLLPSFIGKLICTLFMSVIMFYRLAQRLREEVMRRKNTSPSLLLVYGLLYFVNLQLQLSGLTPVLFELTVISILLFLINSYLINFDHYFSLQQETSNVPFKQIKAVNHTIIIFFLGLSLTSMLAFTRLPLQELFLTIKRGLLNIIRSLLSLLPSADSPISDTQEELAQKVPDTKPFKLPADATPSPFWQFIQNLIMTVITVTIVIAAIALISYVIYKFYQVFYKEKRSLFKDTTEFISPFDKTENAEKDKSIIEKNRFYHFWNQTNSDKIRRAFYKAVLSKKGKPPAPSTTPVEISRYILTNGFYTDKEINEKAEAMAFYYEKARYHKEDCTLEEVEGFKKLLH